MRIHIYLIFILLSTIYSCKDHINYFSNEEGDTVFYQNFEGCELGNQSVPQINQSWKNQSFLWGKKDRILFYLGLGGKSPEIVYHGNRFLKIMIPKHTSGPVPGCQWTSRFDKIYDSLTLEYKVMFDSNFCFVKGGKLPGLAGGLANTGGVKPNGLDGWSARMMFWESGKLCFWIYHKDQPGTFGDSLFFKTDSTYFTFTKGIWYEIKHRIRMNSLGKNNGTIEGFVNGILMAKKDSLEFRKVGNLGIDQLVFSVFLGGEGKDYESFKDEIVFFDNFIIKK